MNIGTIGSGQVAHFLAAGWRNAGHDVIIGTRNPLSDRNREWAAAGGRIGSIVEAVRASQVVLLAIAPWTATESVLAAVRDDLAGKVLIDPSNAIEFAPAPHLGTSERSLGVAIQRWVPHARVVKTLSLVSAELMVNPAAQGVSPAVMWLAGEDSSAKQIVGGLLRDIGWDEVVDLGGIEMSRLQEVTGVLVTAAMRDVLSRIGAAPQ